MTNGSSGFKPLVDYPDDDEEATDMKARPPNLKTLNMSPEDGNPGPTLEPISPRTVNPIPQSPPERLSEKRRREEDEEDELGKLSFTKRRSSSVSSTSSTTCSPGGFLRRKKSFTSNKDSPTGKGKIAISLAVKSPIETDHGRDDGG